MEWDDDEKESNENAETDKSETSKVHHRKSFIPHKKRVILQELESISENNILEGCSDYLSRSVNFNSRQIKKNMNPESLNCSSVSDGSSETTQPETPPAALRQRIIEAQKMQEYLEKELNELKDFTTNEKQVLAAEKGIEELRLQNKQLEESLDELKNKLESSYIEKDLISKELEEMKRKYVDEQTEKQILETKWKYREDDLKKSLEEAWSLLRIKEDRIAKMNEKISYLYSEREKVKDLNFTFGGQLLPTTGDYDTDEPNSSEPFELGPESGQLFDHEVDKKGDSTQNNELNEINKLHEELAKCKDSIEKHEKQIEDLNQSLADKDLLISTYEKNLSQLDTYLSTHLPDDLIGAEKDNLTHKTSIEKIKCDIDLFLSLIEKDNMFISKADTCNVNMEPNECGDTGLVFPCKSTQTDYGVEKENRKIMDRNDTSISSNEQLILIEGENEEYVMTMHNKTEEIKKVEEIENGKLKEYNKEIQLSYEEKDEMYKQIIQYEERIKNNDIELSALKIKLSEYENIRLKPLVDNEENSENKEEEIIFLAKVANYEEAIKSYKKEINALQNTLLYYKEKLTNDEEGINIMTNKVSTYEKEINFKQEEINALQTKISSYEVNKKNEMEEIKTDEVEINSLKTEISMYKEKLENKQDEVNLLHCSIFGQEELISNNKIEINNLNFKISEYEEKIKKKDEEINFLFGKVSGYEDEFKNNEEELNVLKNNLSSFEEEKKQKENELNTLRKNIAVLEETIRSNLEEISSLKNEIFDYKDVLKNKEEEMTNLRSKTSVNEGKLTSYEEGIKQREEEVNMFQNKVVGLEEIIKNNLKEISTLQSKVSDSENKTSSYEEEVNNLKKEVFGYEEKLRKKEEEIDLLHATIVDLRELININKSEMNDLQIKISKYQEKIKFNDDEINKLQNNNLTFEEKIVRKDEEINLLLNKVSSYEDKLKINEEEIKQKEEVLNKLGKNIADLEEKIRNNKEEKNILLTRSAVDKEQLTKYEEEINSLKNEVFEYKEKLKNEEEVLNNLESNFIEHGKLINIDKDEINILQSKISAYEEKIKSYDDEINKLLNSNFTYEEKIVLKDEEINSLLNKVSSYEDILKTNEEEINLLKNKMSSFKEEIKQKEEALNKLKKNVADVEEIEILQTKAFVKEEEIIILKDNVSSYEGRMIKKEEELNLLEFEDTIRNNLKEINMLQTKSSADEEKLIRFEEEIKSLEKKVVEYKEVLKDKEEVVEPHNNIIKCGEVISIDQDEIIILPSKVSEYEDKMKCNNEEVNKLHNSNLAYEERIVVKDEEINLLLNKVSSYEDVLKTNKEEINLLKNNMLSLKEEKKQMEEELFRSRKNVVDLEEKIRNNIEETKAFEKEEEINKLKDNLSSCDERIKEKEEEINMLKHNILNLEETIKNKLDEINMLEIRNSATEEKLNRYEEEMNALEKEVMDFKEKLKNKEEAINYLECKILGYEEKLICYEDEINKLQNNILSYQKKTESKQEEINMLLDQVSGHEGNEQELNKLRENISSFEQTISNNLKEINLLKHDLSYYEDKIKEKEEETSSLQKNVCYLEEVIHNKIDDINILHTKISDYEEKIKHYEEERNSLQNEVSIYKKEKKDKEEEKNLLENNIVIIQNKLKNKDEDINKLLIEVSSYKEKITDCKEEINLLLCKISGCEEIYNLKNEEIIVLQNEISKYEKDNKDKEEQIKFLRTEVSDYMEKMKCYEGIEEKDKATIEISESDVGVSQKKILEYEQEIHELREESMILKNKVFGYEKTIKSYTDEINMLKNKILRYEQGFTDSKVTLVNILPESIKNFDGYSGFNNTLGSNISDKSVYSQTDLVEYDTQPSADNTLNFTTLESTSQLEQSIFISKLPQSDVSIKESDPLASFEDLSYTNEELETTLIDQFNKFPRFDNIKVLHESNLINSTHANYNTNKNIGALINLLNDLGDLTNANFDEISKKLLVIKETLKPTEDYIILGFCQVIENFLTKEYVSKQIWNEKMLVVKETLVNLQKIKDSFSKLKNSYCSFKNITSQDHQTINLHFKNLFLCQRELSAENELLKEQLKVSLLSEEKLSEINELLKRDLTNNLQIEKDYKILTDFNKSLEDKLEEKCKIEKDIVLLTDKIAKLLNPNESWPTDRVSEKLEQIYHLLIESVGDITCENVYELGFIHFFRNIVAQYSVLKQNIDRNVKSIKGDLASLNVDITRQFNNLNSDFLTISCNLSELYEKQEQESTANNIFRDNVQNLIMENKELKEELHNLKILNNNLRTTSNDYSTLMDEYKNLNDILQEKNDLLSDHIKFQEKVCLFVDSLKDLFFMKNFYQFTSSTSLTDKSNYTDFLEWLKTFLNEVHCIHESVLQNIKSPQNFNFSEIFSDLIKDKNDITDKYHALKSEYQLMKQSLMLFPENVSRIKGTLNAISTEVLQSKNSFIQDLITINKHLETLLLSYNQRDIDYDNYKCSSEKSYTELNKKYLELLTLYENLEIEQESSKILIRESIKEKEEFKKEIADLVLKNNEIKESISSYEKELYNYKNITCDLEKKICDVEKEKELIEEHFKQYVTLGEYNHLKADKNKLTEIIQNLNNLNSTLKESCGDLISSDIKNIGDDFVHLRNIIYSLLEVRQKYTTLELNYSELKSERSELLNKIESLNNLVKESVETQNTLKSEIQTLIETNKEQTTSLISEKVMNILMSLGYEEPTKIDDDAWSFIEERINDYKLEVKQNTENDKFKLEEKISYLESQLCDAQDFKSKFSKELHMLKPDLDISYLMSLSLADLQKTMIIAIIEKEKDVIGDYEMKLALSTDRIQQLEEQHKRREDWLQEIEKENERLTNECKQIQDDNEILKADMNLKIRKIIDLENQITQQINKEEIKGYIEERDDSNHQLETAADEKNTLRLSIASLNEKLQNKSIECEEVYNSLQKKAEVIFGLEKVLSKCKTDNVNLEKEVLHLRESMVLNLNNFNDNKQTMEKDLANYKVQIEKLHQLLSDTQKQTATENKSVSTDLDEDVEMESKLQGSLSNHLAKIESLNLKIDDLNYQLKQQNYKFDEEFKNQAKFIECLEKELNIANELNVALKKNPISMHNQKEDAPKDPNLIEGLQSEIMSLREINTLLENEKVLLLNDKELLTESRKMLEEKESLIDSLKKELESMKSKLSEKEDERKTMQEQINNLHLKLDSLGNELTSAQKTIEDLLKQNLDSKKLKDEVTSLILELEQCQIQVNTLLKEKAMKEVELSECHCNLNLEKEINCSVKAALEQTRHELLNLKTEKAQLIEEHNKELESQKYLCSKLNSDLCQLKEIKANQENELSCLKNELKEKIAYLEEISSKSHLDNSCPFKKEADDIKNKYSDISKQLEHERETFKLWKTNLEEDLHCKLLKISDLELKLKKETQCYKEALMSNSELHKKLQESLEKFKRLEDKIAIQRDVFIKEKSKSEMDLQNKEKLLIELEDKLLSVKHKCEEFSKDICIFLKNLSITLQVDVVDFSSAIAMVNDLKNEKQMLVRELQNTQEKAEQLEKSLKETQDNAEFFEQELKKAQEMVDQLKKELRESQEKAEQLEEECEELNNDIKYHENEIGNLYKNGKIQEEKWMKEKEELEKELLQTEELKEKLSSQEKVILSLQTKIENYDKCLVNFNAEKKILESEKQELERKIIDLEKNLESLKNQEISYLDGIKREMNHLKLELFNKNKAISKLEMRLESDTLPYQKKAELAEKKVDELTKELRILKQSQSFKQMSSVLTSPIAGVEMSYSQKNKDETIERLEQEVKQLIREKSALKLLAQNRRVQINELREQLGKKDVNSFQD